MPIQPTYDKTLDQFSFRGTRHAPGTDQTEPHRNMEWRTRGVDYQVSAITSLHVEHPKDAPGSEVADHEWGDFDYTTIDEEDGNERVAKGVGYGIDRMEPDDNYPNTNGVNYDSMVYSWTTPGFHAFSMDDRADNARIRIRTTSGHQIIMDDTNERIYINTAGGESWVEIDSAGNIDIYASRNVSTHAGGDINFTADKTIRMYASQGIHMYTDGDFRTHSQGDFNIRTEAKFRTHSSDETRIHADKDINAITPENVLVTSGKDTHFQAGAILYVSSGAETHINTGAVGHWTTGGEMNLLSGGTMFLTGGSDIHLNGPPATGAQTTMQADEAEEYLAYWTSRVPEHEPWARVFMKKEGPQGADNNGPLNEAKTLTDPNTHNTEYTYTDQNVGRGSAERGDVYTRNERWHR